jgi:SAM-dependent methyltransferase
VDVAAHYAKLTDVDSQTSPDLVRRAVKRALDEHDVSAPLLDLGTGVGGNLPMLTAIGPTVGADISVTALALAREHAPVTTADGARLPFRDGVFGGAVCTEVLEHVEHPEDVLAELGRVLRPGAIAIISTPNYSNPVGLHKLIADRRSGLHDYNPWGAHKGGFEAFMTGRKLWRAARPHFELLEVRALDYGQAITGRFAVTDRIATSRYFYPPLRQLVGWLEKPHPRLPFLAWHGMHVQFVLRRR